MTHTCSECGEQCRSYHHDGQTLRCLPCADKRQAPQPPAQVDDECVPVLDYAQMRANADNKRR